MAFNIQTFADNIATHGTIQTNKFQMLIFNRRIASGSFFPASIISINGLNSDDAEAFSTGFTIHQDRIESVRLPGVVLDTYETRRYGVGPQIATTTNARFAPFSATILADGDMNLHGVFVNWLNAIFDGFSNRSNSSPTYLVNYKSEYSTDIGVLVYNNDGFIKTRYIFHDAFPIGMSEPVLSWNSRNELYKFDISFAYTNWSSSLQRAVPVEQQ
jgi:hypothetical protein